jgi:S-adenosylmethionine decarboxylase
MLIDLFGCSHLDDPERIEATLRAAVSAAGATLLDVRLHHFGPGNGVTGVALLAESHMSIHSWPEHGYAAIDIFLCGERHDLAAAQEVFVRRLDAEHSSIRSISRGFALADADRDQSGPSLPRTRSA